MRESAEESPISGSCCAEYLQAGSEYPESGAGRHALNLTSSLLDDGKPGKVTPATADSVSAPSSSGRASGAEPPREGPGRAPVSEGVLCATPMARTLSCWGNCRLVAVSK